MSEPNVPKALNAKEYELLAFIEQEWLTHGAVPTKDYCVNLGITNGPFYTKCLGNADFRHAMAVRGISLKLNSTGEGRDAILTEEQLVTANAMLDLRDNRSQAKKLREFGVSTAKWEGWLRDPAFQSYLRSRAESLLGDNLHESHLALIDRVRSGDINAIKYFNEITGRYAPNASDRADANAIIMMVLEVLQRKLSNQPDVLKDVSADLLAIARGANPGPPVLQARPELRSIPMFSVNPDSPGAGF